MLLKETVNGPVIKVHSHGFIHEFLESLHDYPGKDSRGVFQPKRHDSVSEGTKLADEGRLALILFSDSDFIIARESVCEGVAFMACYFVQDLIGEGGGKGVG